MVGIRLQVWLYIEIALDIQGRSLREGGGAKGAATPPPPGISSTYL